MTLSCKERKQSLPWSGAFAMIILGYMQFLRATRAFPVASRGVINTQDWFVKLNAYLG